MKQRKKKKKTFEEKIIIEGRDLLLSYLNDFPFNEPRIQVICNKKRWNKISSCLDRIKELGKKKENNLNVSLGYDAEQNEYYVIYEYIFYDKINI